MSDPSRPSQSLDDRLRELRGAPDRTDWPAIVTAARGHQPNRSHWQRRSVVFAGVGIGALTVTLGVLLVRSPEPDDARTLKAPPPPAFTLIAATPRAEVPPVVRRQLGLRPNTPVVRLATLRTPESEYVVWRARNDAGTFTGRYLDFTMDDAGSRGTGGCWAAQGSVFPEDPPGTGRRVAVPDTTGVQLDEAKRRIRAAGFRIGTVTLFDGSKRPPTPSANFMVSAALDTSPALAGSRIDLMVMPRDKPLPRRPPGMSELLQFCSSVAGPDGATLVGATSGQATELELIWPDKTTDSVPVENGAFVLSLPLADCRQRVTPRTIVVRDREGREITKSSLPVEMLWGGRRAGNTRFDPIRCRPSVVDGDVQLSVLDTPSKPFRAATVDSRRLGAGWAAARVAQITQPAPATRRHEIVVAPRNGAIPSACIFVLPIQDDSDPGSGACATHRGISSGLFWTVFESRKRGEPTLVAGLLPDGIVGVRLNGRPLQVRGNTWVAALPSSRTPIRLTLTRSDGATFDLER